MQKMNKLHKKEVLKRKNFLPTLIVTLFIWLALGGIIYFLEPDIFGVLPLFLVLFFFALLFTFSILFSNTRRGFLTSFGLTLFLILRYFGIGNLLNFFLIASILITTEFYFSRK
jgi:uncharacterized membrane protein YbhN (UPF0104 family)